MIRRILCDGCGSDWTPHAKDCVDGWAHRVIRLSAKKPSDHVVKVFQASFEETALLPKQLISQENLTSLVCDICGTDIMDGELCTALSMLNRSDTFTDWEHEYGTVLSDEAYKAAKTLAKQ